MATQPDCYGILQVRPKAEKEVINADYRKLAAKYHPDVSHIHLVLMALNRLLTDVVDLAAGEVLNLLGYLAGCGQRVAHYRGEMFAVACIHVGY